MAFRHHLTFKCIRAINVRRTLSTSSQCHNISSRIVQNSHPDKPVILCSKVPSVNFSSNRDPERTWAVLKHVWKILGGLLLGGVAIKLLKPAKIAVAESASQSGESNDDATGSAIGKKTIPLKDAINQSLDLVQIIKDETGSPGLTIAVSVAGETVWSQGLGYSDVENRLPCTPETIMRIASISKSITMTAVARLWETGDLDLDKPVQFYVPTFPEKYWNGEKVEITTRQLLSHMAGIRHYDKTYIKEKKDQPPRDSDQTAQSTTSKQTTRPKKNATDQNIQSGATVKIDQSAKGKTDTAVHTKPKVLEFEMKEYYIRDNYTSVTESMDIFKDDPLVHKPGNKYLYTSHGWTVISAIVEGASKTKFEKYAAQMLQKLGLDNTHLEYHEPLVYNRGRHYVKNEKGRLVNAPYVDLSYKWAGGGFISNVLDLVKFGNTMLYSYQATGCHGTCTTKLEQSSTENRTKHEKDVKNIQIHSSSCKNSGTDHQCLPGYLKPETMRLIWTPVDNAKPDWDDHKDNSYGMGWFVCEAKQQYGVCRATRYYLSHTGGAVGASSVLLILPSQTEESIKGRSPQGVVVAIITNMTGVGLNEIALKIAKIFEVAKLDT